MIKEEKIFKGKVVFQRTEIKEGDKDCVCCEGNHIFSSYIDFGENQKEIIQEMLSGLVKKDREGREVTMEIKIKMEERTSNK